MNSSKDEFEGVEALNYIKLFLRKVRADADSWEIEYINDANGEVWIMDFPESEQHGGGSPRLRRKK